MSRAEELVRKIQALVGDYPGEETVRDTITNALTGASELHTNSEVARIAGIGDRHPERINHSEIQTLCGAVLRHIEREKIGR